MPSSPTTALKLLDARLGQVEGQTALNRDAVSEHGKSLAALDTKAQACAKSQDVVADHAGRLSALENTVKQQEKVIDRLEARLWQYGVGAFSLAVTIALSVCTAVLSGLIKLNR